MYKLFIGCAFVILRSLSYHQGIEKCDVYLNYIVPLRI